jgi:A/G-specific adenine glycosylase
MALSKTGFADALIDWYTHSHRDLPWRTTRDPYHIWLSEIMLQQTQVATVLPYYARFLTQFPTLQALAEAPAAEVLKAWEGLGYYARARNLQAAAQRIMAEHGGRFPDTLAAVEKLPGIGKSTAGAILTFAYGQRHPILDGNVKRVMARLYDIAEDPADKAVSKQMWGYSEALLAEASDPFSFNQAIMELGATCCTPQTPTCLLCPVRQFCDAQAQGTQLERPKKPEKKVLPHHTIAVGVIWHEGKILIQRRPEKGLLGGLWEFPGGKREPDESLEETVRREIAEELGIKVTVGSAITTVKHAYTHFKITLHAYHCFYVEGTPQPKAADAWQWAAPADLRQFAFPKANIKVLEVLAQQPEPPVPVLPVPSA